jgi:hypothetical protein
MEIPMVASIAPSYVGCCDGKWLGRRLGELLGKLLGVTLGSTDGMPVGTIDGARNFGSNR